MSNLTRRQFFATSSLAVAGGTFCRVPLRAQQPAAPQPAAPQPPPAAFQMFRFEEVRRNVGIFVARGGVVGWLLAPDGVIVIDSQYPDCASVCLGGLRQRTQHPIDTLINTHYHTDHTSGNLVYRPVVARIVAHRNVPALQKTQAIAAKAEASQAYPDTVFDQSWTTKLASETVTARHYGPAHSGGDCIVVFQNANVVHLGDLMFNHRHPRVDRPGGASIGNWIVSLEKIAKEYPADTIFVAAHAKDDFPVIVARADLLGFRDYLTGLLDYARKGIAAGKPVAEIAKIPALPAFPDYQGSPEGPLTMAYEELTAKSSSSAL
jgi:cyclase